MPKALREIPIVDNTDSIRVRFKWRDHRRRQNDDPVLGAFAVAYRDGLHNEIQVLDPQVQAFGQTQSRAVEWARIELWRAFQLREHRPNLAAL